MLDVASVTELDESDLGVLELRVDQLRRESDGVVSLELVDAEGGVLPAWRPGAHIDLLLGDELRQYSLCGDPSDLTRYRVAILREERSRGGSSYVHETLRLGELLEVGGPRNHFELEDHDEYLFLAGGIGITPILPMMDEVNRRGRPWRLIYGGRSRASMAFLDVVGRYGSAVSIVPEDEAGMLDLPAICQTPRDGVGIYACGPAGLLDAVEAHTAEWPLGALHVERFAPRARPMGEIDEPFVAECARTGIDVNVPAGEALLDALEGAGIRLPNACRDGVCGSCEVVVRAGAIDHRDSVLSPLEQAEGNRMMACVSRAADERLVLDL